MGPDENKVLVHRFFAEVINGGAFEQADEFVTADYVEHQDLPGAEGQQGIAVAKGFLSMMRVAFPDFRFEVEDLIAEGDKVAARVSVQGTHRGELMGLAPTGKRVNTSGIEVFRIADGKLAEHWAAFEALDMLQQVGMVPIPGPRLLLATIGHQVKKRIVKVRATRATRATR